MHGLTKALAAAVLSATTLSAQAHCGHERTAIKTLRDTGFTMPRTSDAATIAELVRLARPRDARSSHRSAAERATYTLHNVIVEDILHERDGDLHLVLSDGTHTMIAEIPSEQCIAPQYAPQIRAARHQALGLRGRRADLTGVLFFDYAHGQNGLAPNAVEIHPVTMIRGAQ